MTVTSIKAARTMTLTSPAFADGAPIPAEYGCEADGISVPLAWSTPPSGTRSLALIVDDPEHGAPPRVHWVVYDIPADELGLSGGASSGQLPPGAREGLNEWRRTGWEGPCPQSGRHRYRFRLHALDTVLPDLDRPTRTELERAMHGHVLATAHLEGTYQVHRRKAG